MPQAPQAKDARPAWLRPHDNAATEDDVFYCFRLLLGRSPSPDEWVGHAMQAGGALDKLVAAYLNSREFDERHLLRRAGGRPPLHELPGFRIHASPDDPGNGDLIRRGVYEPHVERQIRARLRPGMGFLDIGANVGYFSLLAAGIVGADGHVYAVEANPDNARLLEASRRLNGFEQLTVLQLAAAAGTGLLALHTMHSTGSATALPDSADWVLQQRTVPSVRLDDVIPDTPRIGLIKIDIDGGEFPALRGAAGLIARHRPALITEFCPGLLTDLSGIDAYGYLDWLRGQGYALSVLHEIDAPAPGSEAAMDNAAILAALSRRGTDHLDLLALPQGPAATAPPVAAARRPAGLEMRADAAEAAARIAAANRHAADAEQRARTAEASLVHTDRARAEANAELDAQAAEIARLAAELAAARRRADTAEDWLAAMRASTSWRLTAPLRRLFRRGPTRPDRAGPS